MIQMINFIQFDEVDGQTTIEETITFPTITPIRMKDILNYIYVYIEGLFSTYDENKIIFQISNFFLLTIRLQ